MRFHRRCGDRVTLLNENTTAIRNFIEFNHGLILSAEPIEDDVIFEVCIDRKVSHNLDKETAVSLYMDNFVSYIHLYFRYVFIPQHMKIKISYNKKYHMKMQTDV